MKKPISIFLLGILATIIGCTKNDPNSNGGGSSSNNSAPTCSITTPQNGATIAYDENISVSVVAEDSDGTIAKVSLYIDEVGYSEKTAFPYNFTILSGVLSPGQHTIKAIAKDNEGSNGESSVTITIEEPATESPDFVSFSDGQIPPTWQTATWYVDNTGGYDDIYSLKVVGEGSVMTTKTIQGKGNLEFLVKGDVSCFNFNINPYGNTEQFPCLKLYIDGSIYFYYTTEAIGSWKKYIVDLEEGTHTFLWEYRGDNSGNQCNIDAIRFSHNSSNLRIGNTYQGGYVGYLDNTRQHGYIISENDLGFYNQSDAIEACNNYSVGQYSDWHLPNSSELESVLRGLWLSQSTIITPSPASPENFYWTSSNAQCGYLGHDGVYIYSINSNNECNVRAIRSF